MTPIVTTLEVELLLIEYMTSDPDLPDFGKVMRLAGSLYQKSPEPEGYCDVVIKDKGNLPIEEGYAKIKEYLDWMYPETEASRVRKMLIEEYGATEISPESECFSAHPQVVNTEPLVDPVDCGIGVTYEPRSCPFGDPCSS